MLVKMLMFHIRSLEFNFWLQVQIHISRGRGDISSNWVADSYVGDMD